MKQIDPADLMTLAGGGAEAVVAGFNAVTGSWDFDLWGDFWNAIYAAHGEGLTGAGNKIAILDSCPDLSIPQLAKGTVLHNLDNDVPSAHGTAVGLLIRYIAPEAELHFYAVSTDGKARRSLVGKAFEMIAEDPVDYVCMSLGDVQPMGFEGYDWIEPYMKTLDYAGLAHEVVNREMITPTVKQCFMNPCTCALVDQAADAGTVILAASGNSDGKMFCPARAPGSLSIGFGGVSASYEDGKTTKKWEAPDGPQAAFVDFTIFQPEGMIGSSFAAPLMTAALALRKGGHPARRLLAPKEINAMAQPVEALMEQMRNNEEIMGKLVSQYNDIVHLMFDQTPHAKIKEPTATDVLEMRLFLAHLAVNKGFHLLHCGEVVQAEAMFGWVRSFAPWMGEAHANFGNVHLGRAAFAIEHNTDLVGAGAALTLAREAYAMAMEAQPGNPAFQDGMDGVNHYQARLDALLK